MQRQHLAAGVRRARPLHLRRRHARLLSRRTTETRRRAFGPAVFFCAARALEGGHERQLGSATQRAAALEAEADRAAARGDAAAARALLEQVDRGRSGPGRALAQARGHVPRRRATSTAALAAVSGALRVDPLGFVPLLLKANLLEQPGRSDEAGEAYGHALAQRPAAVPPHLAAMVAHAEQLPRGACRARPPAGSPRPRPVDGV